MLSPFDVLKKYWGYDSFNLLQEEIINAILNGKDVVALLPTGGGKSLCFQIPALIREGLCIVVSPLIALMKDQVFRLKKLSIPAEYIFSGMNFNDIDAILDSCVYGKVKLLYVSPERLKTEIFLERVKKMNVNLLAIDEAHCISQWGYDFRPQYLQIADLRKELDSTVNVIALTATATKLVKDDIIEKLSMKSCVVFQSSFERENLVYISRYTEDKKGQLFRTLNKVKGSSIVYVNTRQKSKEIANWLNSKKINATFYNAGLNTNERTKRQDAWINNSFKVMVATNAFGMGIDKADVRMVVHTDLPMTLESYYQETGRAGRDNKKSYVMLMYEKNDKTSLMEMIANTYPQAELLMKVYQNFANYYQIAIGSCDKTYEFDLEQFSYTYKLQPHVVHSAFKSLELEGLLQLSEAFFEPSKLSVCVSPRDLNYFQSVNHEYDPIIKAVTRLYGGELFSRSCSISEIKLSKYLCITLEKVRSQLTYLDKISILKYRPQNNMPKITLTSMRCSPKYCLNEVNVRNRFNFAQKKAEAVWQYAIQTHKCRPQVLLEYFNEVSLKKCSKCDICFGNKEGDVNSIYDKYKELIFSHWKGYSTIENIVNMVEIDEEKKVQDVIRLMLANGDINYY